MLPPSVCSCSPPPPPTVTMMPDSSAASTSAESADDFSIGREATSTPATSPVFSSRHDSILETLGNFTTLGLAPEPAQNGTTTRLPDMLNPATAAGIDVKNVCFVGAGYVGKFARDRSPLSGASTRQRGCRVYRTRGGAVSCLSITCLTPRNHRGPDCCSHRAAESSTPRHRRRSR